MQFTITAAGITAIINAGIGGPKIDIVNFKLSDAVAYTPTGAETTLPGTPVGGTYLVANYALVGTDIAQWKLVLDETVGNFSFGTIGLYVNNGGGDILFALGSLPTLINKLNTSSSTPNKFVLNAECTYANLAPLVTFSLNPLNAANVMNIAGVHQLLSPSASDSNYYLCSDKDDGDSNILVYKNGTDQWAINDFSATIGVSPIASADSGTALQLTSTAIGTALSSYAAGRYLVQFTSGAHIGQVRSITATGLNTISWSQSLASAVTVGTTFKIYTSNFYRSGATGLLPSQAGNATYFLITDGVNPSWSNALPKTTKLGMTGVAGDAVLEFHSDANISYDGRILVDATGIMSALSKNQVRIDTNYDRGSDNADGSMSIAGQFLILGKNADNTTPTIATNRQLWFLSGGVCDWDTRIVSVGGSSTLGENGYGWFQIDGDNFSVTTAGVLELGRKHDTVQGSSVIDFHVTPMDTGSGLYNDYDVRIWVEDGIQHDGVTAFNGRGVLKTQAANFGLNYTGSAANLRLGYFSATDPGINDGNRNIDFYSVAGTITGQYAVSATGVTTLTSTNPSYVAGTGMFVFSSANFRLNGGVVGLGANSGGSGTYMADGNRTINFHTNGDATTDGYVTVYLTGGAEMYARAGNINLKTDSGSYVTLQYSPPASDSSKKVATTEWTQTELTNKLAALNPVIDELYKASLCLPNAQSYTFVQDVNSAVPDSITLRYAGGVLGPDGLIYFVPYSSDVIGVYDPISNILNNNTDLGAGLSSGGFKWIGGCLAPNGKIYCVPNNATDILIIDTLSGTASTSTMGAIISGTANWRGGVLAPNGKIYCIPLDASDVLVIDPIAGTASYLGASLGAGGAKWWGGVLGKDGNIYGIPYASNTILKINPVAGTATTSAMGASLSGGAKWIGGCIGADGKIYGIPHNSTDILIINTTAQTATRSTLGASLTGTSKWNGGAVGADGRIYGIPQNASDILQIDTIAGVATRFGSVTTAYTSTNMFNGGVLAPNGKIFGIPSSGSSDVSLPNVPSVVHISPYVADRLPLNVTLSPYLNKL